MRLPGWCHGCRKPRTVTVESFVGGMAYGLCSDCEKPASGQSEPAQTRRTPR